MIIDTRLWKGNNCILSGMSSETCAHQMLSNEMSQIIE